MKPVLANNLSQKLKKGNILLIDDLFYSIQCEGPFTGKPAFFIRLFGCNLNCSFCDTPQTIQPSKFSVKELARRADKEANANLVVITGGEPFRQNIWPLIDDLCKRFLIVQIETNGVFTLPKMNWERHKASLHIVVSPKTKKINKDIAAHALCFKYIIKAGKVNANDGLPNGLYRPDDAQKIIVSPMWEKSKKKTAANIEETVAIAKHFGYHFSYQYHKTLGIE